MKNSDPKKIPQFCGKNGSKMPFENNAVFDTFSSFLTIFDFLKIFKIKISEKNLKFEKIFEKQ